MNKTRSYDPCPEVWGGIECTVNRVQDRYNDQLERSGHVSRIEDLDLFAELGIRALRYPVLWERFASHGSLEDLDWSWADERLHRLRSLGIRPIVGLVHHGSGPRHTSLVDPSFSEGLSLYAGKVAERFPWIQDWTPVNEPMTTARFSGLYGHWYPHGRDEKMFARALIQECKGVALSMRAIRKINPAARLIQTDDLGKIYSTPHLKYQADFENERRWLAWDLLSGLVDKYHRMWGHLLWAGVSEADLHWFLENPCPPDIIGVNHYLTSERFLDEKLESYPPSSYGHNGRDPYADVEAVRVLPYGTPGIRGILQEVWQRYRRPIAVTEVHLGCTREEQMRWLLEAWNSANDLCRAGVDIRAITAWALLGSYDWNSLLTRFEGHYEPGVFDLRGGKPRSTALASLIRDMAAGKEPRYPVLAKSGWWKQSQRLLYRTQPDLAPKIAHLIEASMKPQSEPARPVLITGAKGTLGYAFSRLCHHRNLTYVALTREEMDITDPASVEAALKRYDPWAVVNTAGYVRVDDAQGDEERCYRENTSGPALLATACERRGIRLVTFSSDLVFNGRQRDPYVESDSSTPMNVYGRSKAKMERCVLDIMPSALVVRTSAFFGPWDAYNFVTMALQAISAGQTFQAAEDVVISPTYVPDLVHACLDLLIDGESGIWHLANQGAVTWKEFAEMAAECAGLDKQRIEGCSLRSLNLAAPRPHYSVLATERGQVMQSLEGAIDCYLRDCGIPWAETAPTGEHVRRSEAAHSDGTRSRTLRERVMPVHRHALKRK